MKEMAGKKGQVLRYPDFKTLTKRFNEELDALCRKYFFFQKQFSLRQQGVLATTTATATATRTSKGLHVHHAFSRYCTTMT